MSLQKIIFILAIFIAELCSAQSDTTISFSETPFSLTDNEVFPGQYYRLFDLSFSGVDTLKTVSSDKRLDSLVTLINTLKVGNIMVMYNHYSEKGDFDYNCVKLGWNKAAAIKEYLREKGLKKSNIVLKGKCYKPTIKNKIKCPSRTNNPKEFATVIILNP